jgi:hypothetical protein
MDDMRLTDYHVTRCSCAVRRLVRLDTPAVKPACAAPAAGAPCFSTAAGNGLYIKGACGVLAEAGAMPCAMHLLAQFYPRSR